MQTTDESRATRGGEAALRLKGIDHLAFVTDDMMGTIRFYTDVLGMQLVHVRRVPYAPDRGQPPYDNCRHYFFDMGNDSLLAFFEYPKDAPRADRDAIGGMQHVAFHADRPAFERCQERLREHGVSFVGPFHLGGRFHSIYFRDNNGIRLEITTDLDKDAYETVDTVRQTEAEAREELETLYATPAQVQAVLDAMPLLDGPR